MRENQTQYTDFADHMIRAVHGKSRYGEAAERVNFDTLISKSQEAFTLLLYENGYQNWVWAASNDPGTTSDGSSDDTGGNTTDGLCPMYKYTVRHKETMTSRNGGWSVEGMMKYNELYRRVSNDRTKDGGSFSAAYRMYRDEKRTRAKKRKRGTVGPRQILTISDDLNDLLQDGNSTGGEQAIFSV